MIQEAIAKLAHRQNLSEEEATAVMAEIMNGEATEAQMAAFLMGLRMKGETTEEITGCAKVMRAKALRIKINKAEISLDRDDINVDRETIIDTCGTGGDSTNTFNVSTATAFVVAGAGCLVAKHGNRSVSSLCGSADVVRCLGVNIDLKPQYVGACLNEVGIGFFYAPLYHSAMRFALPVRSQIGIRTIFNILGPLTNPADANIQVLGVYNAELTQKMAEVLRNLGSRSAMVVYGSGNLDEVSIVGPTQIAWLKEGAITTEQITPEEVGLPRATLADIRGGNAEENAEIILNILNGKTGPPRNIVLINAAAAFLAASRVSNWIEGIKLAADTIDSGRALAKLQALIEFSNRPEFV